MKGSIVGISYLSLFYRDLEKPLAFYRSALGEPEYTEGEGVVGWKLGRTWLTLLQDDAAGTPSSLEFAIETTTPDEAESLQDLFVGAGATQDGRGDEWMYEHMRYCPVTDPFGTKILIYSPTGEPGTK